MGNTRQRNKAEVEHALAEAMNEDLEFSLQYQFMGHRENEHLATEGFYDAMFYETAKRGLVIDGHDSFSQATTTDDLELIEGNIRVFGSHHEQYTLDRYFSDGCFSALMR